MFSGDIITSAYTPNSRKVYIYQDIEEIKNGIETGEDWRERIRLVKLSSTHYRKGFFCVLFCFG